MSDEETQILQTEDGQMLTAEYRDGQLQIVEVSAFDKENDSQLLSELASSEETRYVQVMDGDKGIVHLDLLSLIKCSNDSETTYQVVGTSSEDGDTTFTCVLADEEDEEGSGRDSYVVVEPSEGREPLVYVQSSLQQIRTQQTLRNKPSIKPLTPQEIMAKAKILQKAKSLNLQPQFNKTGRKRKSDLPPPMELITTPGFKLYLYSCKMCNYKCNAMPEMSKHKATEHGAGKKTAGRSPVAPMQCARCPFRATTHAQLQVHTINKHRYEDSDESGELILSTEDGESAEVLVCGACGYESGSRKQFQNHVQTAHSLTLDTTSLTMKLQDDNSHPN